MIIIIIIIVGFKVHLKNFQCAYNGKTLNSKIIIPKKKIFQTLLKSS